MSYTGNTPQFEGLNAEGQTTKVVIQPTAESSGTGFLRVESASTGAYAGNICMFRFVDRESGNPYFIIENQNGTGTMFSRALFGLKGHDGMFQHETGNTFRIEQWGGGLGSLTADSLNTATLTASGAVSGSNLSGTNTGDQNLTVGTSLDLSGNLNVAGNIIADGAATVIRLKGYTVAGLPTGVEGDTAYCTDLLAPTFFATAVGGGAVIGPVFHNGTIWICT